MSATEEREIDLPTPYQSQIFRAHYARWREEDKRRETWPEAVDRYLSFMFNQVLGCGWDIPEELKTELRENYLAAPGPKGGAVGSMRALATAGPALARDHAAGYNCAYLAIDRPQAFDETIYLLACFHPDTLISTRTGPRKISELEPGEKVMSYDEKKDHLVWAKVKRRVKTPSASKRKLRITLENDESFDCTHDHRWLTSNRGWVRAEKLTLKDDLVRPEFRIYKITNSVNDKVYVGQTVKPVEKRLSEHLYSCDFHDEIPLYRAMRKHGPNIWRVELIDVAYDYKEALNKEKQWIAELGTYEYGYNGTRGGEGGWGAVRSPAQRARMGKYKRTEAHKERMREVIADLLPRFATTRKTMEYREAQRSRNLGENNPMWGRKYTDEQIARHSVLFSGEGNPFYGKHHTEASLEKMRQTLVGRDFNGKNNPFYGQKHTEATKQKMRAVWAARREVKSTEMSK